jgi:BCD family chlorophyll transporter-like MFS transporter
MSGLALGAWGAVQATSAGLAIAVSGTVRDTISALSEHGTLGPAFAGPDAGYSAVYHIEILLLFATLAAIGPLVRSGRRSSLRAGQGFGLAEMPG